MRNAIIIGVLCCTISAAGFAQEKWTLTTADFQTEPVTLKSLDLSGVKVVKAAGGEAQTIGLDRFLEVERNVPLGQGSGKFVLHMTGQDRLSGEPVKLLADSLVWKNAALGEISIPGSRLVAVTTASATSAPDQKHEDVVVLANSDSVHGIIAAMTAEKVTVQTAAGNTDVPIASVATISFAATPGGRAGDHGFRVRIDDGSSLVGLEVRVEANDLVLLLDSKTQRKISLDHVAAIEQVNGPVSWLSSRPPAQALYYPFIGPPQEPAAYMEHSWPGHSPIEFKGRPFAHGIGVHAYSRISWTLDGTFAAFRTQYAIDGDSSLADVAVRVLLDDKVVYERKNVRAGWLSPAVVADLAGIRKLTLEVDGAAGYAQDSLNWINAALLRQKPAPQPNPPEPVPPAEPTTRAATQPTTKPSSNPTTELPHPASAAAVRQSTDPRI